MAALGSCTSMTLRMFADASGWPLDSVAVRVRETCAPGAHLPEASRFARSHVLLWTAADAAPRACAQLASRAAGGRASTSPSRLGETSPTSSAPGCLGLPQTAR